MLEVEKDSGLDIAQIESEAIAAMMRAQKVFGTEDIYRDIAKAVAAAIAEYDRQKSQ